MTNNKDLKAVDPKELSATTGNIYKSVATVIERAKQLATRSYHAFTEELEELTAIDPFDASIDEVSTEELLSERYESMPKSHNIALEEFMSNKLVAEPQEEPEEEVRLFMDK